MKNKTAWREISKLSSSKVRHQRRPERVLLSLCVYVRVGVRRSLSLSLSLSLCVCGGVLRDFAYVYIYVRAHNININFHIGFPKNCLMVSSIAWSHGIALHNQRYTHSGQRRRAYPLQGKPYVSSFFTCTQKKTSYLYRHLTINISCTPNPPQLQCLVIRDGGESVWGGEGIHTHTHFLLILQ